MLSDSPSDWNVAVEWDDSGGFAYRPGEILARSEGARIYVQELLDRIGGNDGATCELVEPDVDEGLAVLVQSEAWWIFRGATEPLGAIDASVAAGFTTQPNHVFFADNGCEHEHCPPHPSLASDLEGLIGNPLKANPLKANPLKANPLKANPLKANPLKANAPPTNSAVPTTGPMAAVPPIAPAGAVPRIIVFDTGIADSPGGFGPAMVGSANVSGTTELPDTHPAPHDGYLDPVAGHGTFIAGLIEQRCPGTAIEVRDVIGPLGDADESAIASAIVAELAAAIAESRTETTIFNLSLSGYVMRNAGLLASRIGLCQTFGIVVVASAGNTGSCRPAFPAAFPGVVSVGALGPCGPADFTSFGSWVRACAPGVDLVSWFFDGFNGDNPSINGVDPDDFHGLAVWSGTSFSAPIVVAALARHMMLSGGTAKQAVTAVIDAEHLSRIPYLGTIVNL